MTEPSATPTTVDDVDDLVHLSCCNPRRALCGRDVTGYATNYDTAPITCGRCDFLDEVGARCGGRLCRLRQRLRILGWVR